MGNIPTATNEYPEFVTEYADYLDCIRDNCEDHALEIPTTVIPDFRLNCQEVVMFMDVMMPGSACNNVTDPTRSVLAGDIVSHSLRDQLDTTPDLYAMLATANPDAPRTFSDGTDFTGSNMDLGHLKLAHICGRTCANLGMDGGRCTVEQATAAPTPLPTPHPTPAVQAAGAVIVGSMTVANVNYAALCNDQSLKTAFENACKSRIASAASTTPANVEVTLSSGSVIIDYTIAVPSSSGAAVNTALTDAMGGDFANNMVADLEAIPGITDIVSGGMSVTYTSRPQVSEAPASSSEVESSKAAEGNIAGSITLMACVATAMLCSGAL
jgi:hypothetical protein